MEFALVVEKNVPIPERTPRKDRVRARAIKHALKNLDEGDCLVIHKCALAKNGQVSRTYFVMASELWKPNGYKPVTRKFYDNDDDAGVRIWKVKR